MKRLKTISLWGKNNPIKAQIIIALSHLILWFLGVYLGVISYIYEIPLPYEIIPILVSLFFLAYLFYPKKGQQNGWRRHSYTRQKTMDGLLIVTSFLVLVLGVHRFAVEPLPSQTATAQFIVNTSPNQQSEKFNLRKTFKSVKKKLKNDLKELKNRVKNRHNGTTTRKSGQAFLIFLTIMLLIFLIGISVGLSCRLRCSGRDTLAIVVLIGGIISSIWLTITIMNRLIHEKT